MAYIAPFYTKEQIDIMGEDLLHYPFSDDDAVYIGLDHQYELTSKYFQVEIDGNQPDKVRIWLTALRRKFYTKIYNTNKSTRQQLNYIIAVRGIRGYTPFEYRQAFLEAMFIEGEYLLDNGDISGVAGIDLDTMQNMSEDVVRNQERDFHKDAIEMLKTLGLRYYGKYNVIPQGAEW